MSNATKGKLSLAALVLMIFTSVYGFTNIPRAFFKMGYAAIPWYIVGGLLFFIPYAFMVTELGSAFKEEKGGIYSWMEKSVGPKFAFIGTFMWYASYIIWMVNVSNGLLVPISTVVFGVGMDIAPLFFTGFAILWMLLVTFLSSKGLDSIKKFTSLGGLGVLSLNVILLIGALIVFIGNGGQAATPINAEAFVNSPNPTFVPSLVGFISFLVYAIFAYGGVEAVAGLVDQTENPSKNFPKGVIGAAIFITVGYSLLILLTGFFVNYQADWGAGVADGSIHLGNVGYQVMSNLGHAIGNAYNFDGTLLAEILSRFTGLTMFITLSGAFFTLIYSPIKQIIEGTPEELWPGKLGQQKDGMPLNAMKVQMLIVIGILLANGLISIVNAGGASAFFQILTNMTNVSMTLPYLFVVFAFYRFKQNKDIPKPFVIYKSKWLVLVVTIVVFIVIGFANLFSIIEPIITNGITTNSLITTGTMIFGPVFFGTIAYIMMSNYQARQKRSK